MPRLPAFASSREETASKYSPSVPFRSELDFTTKTSKRSLMDSGLDELLQQEKELEAQRVLLEEAQKKHEERMAFLQRDFWGPECMYPSEASKRRQLEEEDERVDCLSQNDISGCDVLKHQREPQTETLRCARAEPRESLSSLEGGGGFLGLSPDEAKASCSSLQLARPREAPRFPCPSRAPLPLVPPVPSSSSTLPSPASAPPLTLKSVSDKLESSPHRSDCARLSAFRTSDSGLRLSEHAASAASGCLDSPRGRGPLALRSPPPTAAPPQGGLARGSSSARLSSEASTSAPLNSRTALGRLPADGEPARRSSLLVTHEGPSSLAPYSRGNKQTEGFSSWREKHFCADGPCFGSGANSHARRLAGLEAFEAFEAQAPPSQGGGPSLARRHILAPPQALRQSALDRIAGASGSVFSTRGTSRERRRALKGDTYSFSLDRSQPEASASASSEGPARVGLSSNFGGEREGAFSARRRWAFEEDSMQIASPGARACGVSEFHPSAESGEAEEDEAFLGTRPSLRRALLEASPSSGPASGPASGAAFSTPNPEGPASTLVREIGENISRLCAVSPARLQSWRRTRDMRVAVLDREQEEANGAPATERASFSAQPLASRQGPCSTQVSSSGSLFAADRQGAPRSGGLAAFSEASSEAFFARKETQRPQLAGEAEASACPSCSTKCLLTEKGSSLSLGFESSSSASAFREFATMALKEPRRQPQLRVVKQQQSPSPPTSSTTLSLTRVSLTRVSSSAALGASTTTERRLTSAGVSASVGASSSGVVKPQSVWNVELPAACRCPLPPSNTAETEPLVKVGAPSPREGLQNASVFLELKRCRRCGRLPLTSLSFASSASPGPNGACKRDPEG